MSGVELNKYLHGMYSTDPSENIHMYHPESAAPLVVVVLVVFENQSILRVVNEAPKI